MASRNLRATRSHIVSEPSPNCLRYLYDIFDAFRVLSEKISKIVSTTLSDYMVSTKTAWQLDLEAFARKRKRDFRPDPCPNLEVLFFGCVCERV